MRPRPALRRTLSLTVVAMLAVSLTACSGGDGKITIGKASDAPATSEAPSEETTAETDPPPTAPNGDVSIPDIGTIPEGLPEDMAKCAELANAMSSMAMSAVGAPIPEETKAEIERIRAGLPEDVAKDLDTLVDAYTTLTESGGDLSKAAAALSSPEFSAATDRLSAYFQKSCAG